MDSNQLSELIGGDVQLLSAIIENIPDMIFLKEAKDLRFVLFNKAGEELLGFKRSEMIGKNDHDFFSKEQADFFTSKDREVMESKTPLDIPEEKIQTKFKGERLLHTKKIPLLDQDGQPQYLLGISYDITERRQNEAALRHSEEKFRMIADFTYNWEYWLAPDGRYVYISPSVERISGYTAVEIMADPDLVIRMASPQDKELVAEHWNKSADPTKEEANLEYRIIRRDGQEVWISHHCWPIFDSMGKFLGRRGTNADISEKKKWEEELRKKENNLQKMNDLMIGRELKMVQLKKELSTLRNEIDVATAEDKPGQPG